MDQFDTSIENEAVRLGREDAMIAEGLADIEAGRVVPLEAVLAWMDSLDTDNPLPPPMPGRA